MGRIPEDTIQTIRDRTDLVDLIGRHVSLKKSGRRFTGLCPFHHEKTPSFGVNPERGVFHCFGCGESGDAFGFLMRRENLTFPEAARVLAAQVGVEIPEEVRGESGLVERVLAANAVAQRLYQETLASPQGEPARAYLARRGLDDAAIRRFGIGLAPNRWDGVASALARERIPAELGERAGLLKARESGGHYDLLRWRVTFPIQDVRGRIVGFGGRSLADDQQPKYLNSPESPVFRKRESFYGFPHALEPIRRRDRVAVVEGYFDALALHRAGVEEVVATCGTALSEDHGRNLRRRTRNVVLVFDGDEAGQRAALRAMELLLPLGLRVCAAALPPGDDPDTLLAREGAEALAARIDRAPPALEMAIARATAGGCATPWEKADAVAAVAPLLAAVPDAVERREFVRQLAWSVGGEERDVEAAVRAAARGGQPEPPVAPPRRDAGVDRRLADFVRTLLAHPELAAEVARDQVLECAPEGSWRELLGPLFDACTRGEALDVAGLADELPEATAARLMALCASEEVAVEEPEQAHKLLSDTLAWLRRKRSDEEQRALTRRFREPGADARELLLEKQRQLERRRQAGSVPS